MGTLQYYAFPEKFEAVGGPTSILTAKEQRKKQKQKQDLEELSAKSASLLRDAVKQARTLSQKRKAQAQQKTSSLQRTKSPSPTKPDKPYLPTVRFSFKILKKTFFIYCINNTFHLLYMH